MGGIVGGSFGSFLVVRNSDGEIPSTYSALEAATAIVGGALFGGAIGAGTGAFKKTKKFEIKGD